MMARHHSMCVCMCVCIQRERCRERAKEGGWYVKYVACVTLYHSVPNLTIRRIGVFVYKGPACVTGVPIDTRHCSPLNCKILTICLRFSLCTK